MRPWLSMAVGLILVLGGCSPRAYYSGELASDSSAPTRSTAFAPTAGKEAAAGLPASAPASPAANPPKEAIERKIVYTADVNLVVENFDPVAAKINEMVKQYGAVIAHSNVLGSPGMPRRGDWTIRVPVNRYNDLLTAARQLGEIRTVQSDSQDVTEEYYDVAARIRNKKQEEERLLKLLDTAVGNLKEILEIEREISRVREEVERIEGRMRVLTDITSLSTVKLHVEEVKNYVPQKEPTYATRARRTFEGSLGAMLNAGQEISLGLVAFAPWAAVLVVVGVPAWGLRRLSRRRKTRGENGR